MQTLVGRLDSYLLTHTKKYMTPIHALIFEKHVKSRCKFVTLLGKYAQQKLVGWEIIFSELGFAGSGARKPRRELYTVNYAPVGTRSFLRTNHMRLEVFRLVDWLTGLISRI